MDILKQMEELLTNKQDFIIEDIFKLYTSLSHLHTFQGRILAKLLRMSASMIQTYNEEVILNKKVHSTAKHDKTKKIPKSHLKSQSLEIIPLVEIFDQNLQEEIQNDNITADSHSEIIVPKSIIIQQKSGARKQDPFKKKFKKIKRDHTQQQRGKICKLELKQFEQKSQTKLRIQSKAKLLKYFTVVEKSDIKQRLYKQTIRNKEDRRQLSGHLCEDCCSFLQGLNATDEYIKKWCQQCSKHRGRNNVINQDLNLFPSQ